MNQNRIQESTLAVIPGTDERQRLVVVLRSLQRPTLAIHDPDQPSLSVESEREQPATFCEQVQTLNERPVVLRQESFSPAVGWFTQSTLEMTLPQWQAMRCTVMPSATTPAAKVTSQKSYSLATQSEPPQIFPMTSASA